MNLNRYTDCCKAVFKPLILIISMTAISHFSYAQLQVREYTQENKVKPLKTVDGQSQDATTPRLTSSKNLDKFIVRTDTVNSDTTKFRSLPYLRKGRYSFLQQDSTKLLSPLRNRWITNQD